MSVVDQFADSAGGSGGTLEQRRALFRRRRIALGLREWVSVAATGAIGLWVCTVVVISVQPR